MGGGTRCPRMRGYALVVEGPWSSWAKSCDPTGEATMPHVRGLQAAQSLRGQQRDGRAVGLSPGQLLPPPPPASSPAFPGHFCSRPREAGAGTLGTAGHGQGRPQPPAWPRPAWGTGCPRGGPTPESRPGLQVSRGSPCLVTAGTALPWPRSPSWAPGVRDRGGICRAGWVQGGGQPVLTSPLPPSNPPL